MAKDPAFLFYSSDFLSGIQDLSMEERGQYITLLCLQHQKGHLSEKIISLAVANAAADVMAKFRQDSAGLWYNVRLDQEIEKRKLHTEKQRERAIEGWKKRKNGAAVEATANAAALPLENENKDENVIGINALVLRKEIEDAIFNDEIFISEIKRMNPNKDLRKAFDQCYQFHSQKPTKLNDWEWRQKFGTWLNKFEATKDNKNKFVA